MFSGGKVSYIADSASASHGSLMRKQVCGVETCDVMFHFAAGWAHHHVFIKDAGMRVGAREGSCLWRGVTHTEELIGPYEHRNRLKLQGSQVLGPPGSA